MSKLSAKIGNIIKNPTPASPHQAGVILPFAGIFAPNGWALCQGQEISKTIYTDLFSALSFSQTVTTSNTSTSVTTSSTSNLNVGAGVSGTGIPAGAYVASITNSTTFVLSSAATASGSVTAVFALYDRQMNPTTGSVWAATTSGFFRVPDLRGVFLRGAGTASGMAAVTVGGYQADSMQGHYHSKTETNHSHSVGSLQNVGLTAGASNYSLPGSSTTTGGSNSNVAITSPATDGTNGNPRTSAETRPLNRGVTYIIKLWNDTTYGISVGVADHQKEVTSGLVPVNGLSARSVIGDTTGTAVPTGYIGEVIFNTQTQSTLASGLNQLNLTSTVITPGIWLVQCSNEAGGLAPTRLAVYLLDAANAIINDSAGDQPGCRVINATDSQACKINSGMYYMRVSTSTTFKVRTEASFPSSGGNMTGNLKAVRIA